MDINALKLAIKKEHWEYLVDRREALLHRSFTAACYDYFFAETGIKIPKATVVRPGGEVWYPRSVLEKIRQTFRNGGVQRCMDFRKRLLRTVGTLDRLATRHAERASFVRASDTALRRMLLEFITLTVRANAFLLPFPVADSVLVNLIRAELPAASPEEQTEWIRILTFPTRENTHSDELRSLYKLAALRLRRREQAIAVHCERFGWIGSRGLWWHDAWTPTIIRKRLATIKNPATELRRLMENRRAILGERASLVRTLAIRSRSILGRLLAIARDYAYLRTWRTDVIYGSSYRARGLFQELSRRSGVPYVHLPYLTYHEFLEFIKTFRLPISSRELHARIAAGKDNLVTIRVGAEISVYTGKKWVQYFQKLVRHGVRTKQAAIARGQTAYPGIVRGRVSVVRSQDELSKVRRGDILVTVMTFPNFIPAMEKAAAFVTDEGGILCHAAIVSREMKKPCVIGTKVATKTFKDGDRVSVDATNGVVKKI